jgi:hypothetical protein
VPAPPPKPPPGAAGPAKPGLQKQPSDEDALARSKREKEELEGDTQAAEEELEALKAKYDMYFLGVERREPNRWRDDVKKKVMRLKGAFTRNTGLKFRIQSLHARYLSYERLWLRTAREKEEGTYRRDLFKARLRARGEGAADPDAPAPPKPARGAAKKAAAAKADAPAAPASAAKAAPSAQAAAAPPAAGPTSVSASPAGMSESQMRVLYDAYLAAKTSCREDVSRLTYDAVARSVSKQIPELVSRYKAKSVEFKVEVKDGKAVLKAVPKV